MDKWRLNDSCMVMVSHTFALSVHFSQADLFVHDVYEYALCQAERDDIVKSGDLRVRADDALCCQWLSWCQLACATGFVPDLIARGTCFDLNGRGETELAASVLYLETLGQPKKIREMK